MWIIFILGEKKSEIVFHEKFPSDLSTYPTESSTAIFELNELLRFFQNQNILALNTYVILRLAYY